MDSTTPPAVRPPASRSPRRLAPPILLLGGLILAAHRPATIPLPAPAPDPARMLQSPRIPARPRPAPEPPPALTAIDVLPHAIALYGPRSEQQLLVLGQFSDGSQQDLTRSARFTSATPATVRVDARGIIHPVANGPARVMVRVASAPPASVPVALHGIATPRPPSFGREVLPVLSKLGCNAGSCHGQQHGKGGFKLSLFASDPETDYPTIVKGARGRRVVLTDPERSLLLLKPTLTIKHGGGLRLPRGSAEYRTILEWLDAGAPQAGPNDLNLARLEVLPRSRLMRPGERQQIIVRAFYGDGTSEDVTRKARFTALNEGLATISRDGLATAVGRGQAAIMVRYMGLAGISRIVVPYRTIPSFPAPVRKSFIDDLAARKWRQLGLVPSPPCSDSTFLRRVYLDVIGTLPPPEEARGFLADPRPDKRARLIDRVLDHGAYADFWALKWSDLLRNNRQSLGEKGMWSFHNWIRASFRDNKPFDRFFTELVTARGSTFTTGPANFYRVASNPQDLAETTSQVFLGVRLQCARCHHHPYEKWSQDDYYGLAAFFARVGAKPSNEFGLFGGEQVVRVLPTGEVGHPKKGVVMKPTPLDGKPVDDPNDRRRALARWLTAPDNLMFARNVVNRYWGYFMGRGIVEPIDDMRVTNPPSNPALLDALARDFIAHKYDVKHLIRTILSSAVYQASAVSTPENRADFDNTLFAHYPVKRLTAEVLLDAIDTATGAAEKFAGLPAGTRAIQLPDPGVASFFLDVFGRPPRVIACECERTAMPNITQALDLMNGDLVNSKVASGTGRVARLLAAKTPLPAAITELYWVVYSRPPAADELATAEKLVRDAGSPREGLEDVLWGLLNTKEFLFNH